MSIDLPHMSIDLSHMSIDLPHMSIDLPHMSIDLPQGKYILVVTKLRLNVSEIFNDEYSFICFHCQYEVY